MSDPKPDHYSTISILPDTDPRPTKVIKPQRKRSPGGKKTGRKLPPLNPYLITALMAALLFAIYCGVGFLVAPALISGKLTRSVQKYADMDLAIGDTQFNPFTFHVHLSDITLSTSDTSKHEPVFLKAADLRMNIRPLMLLRDNLVCSSLQISKLALTLIRYSDKKYNVSQLFNTQATSSSEEIFELSKLPFLFSFNNISITDSSVFFDDRVSGKSHKAEKIELTLPTLSNFSSQEKISVSPRFSAVINGSPVQLTGEAAMPDNKGGDQTRLSFDLHDLDLPLYFGYFPLSSPVQLVKGTAEGRIQVSFIPDKDQAKRLTILFQMDTKGIEMLTQDNSLTVAIPTARLEGTLQPFTSDLHLQSVLIHEPVVHLKENFSEQTLDSLLPTEEKSKERKTPERATPGFVIDLFIMDNGTLHLFETQGKKNQEKTYQSLQLSIKNYTSLPGEGHDTPETGCSITLSGEQLSPSASFSWQGQLNDKNSPTGKVQLNHFPASLISNLITEDNEEMSGSADMTGTLSIQRNSRGKKRFSYTLSDGSASITDLGLFEKRVEWLHAGTLTIGPVDSKNNTLDIGNILIKNASLTLRQNHLPRFLESLTRKGSACRLHGIDFSGNVTLKASEKTGTPLVFNDLNMQANNLEKDARDKENFAVTGKAGRSGEIKAKGTVALGPLRASLSVEFSGMQSKELLPWYTDAPFLLEGQARMDGIGHLTYPNTAFKGSLRISEARFENKPAKSSLAWTEMNLQDFTYSRTPFHLSFSAAQIDRPVLTYLQADAGVFEQTAGFLRDLLPKGEQKNRPKGPLVPDMQAKEITFKDGTLVYKDARLAPPWQQEISALQGQIGNVSFPSSGTAATCSFAGMLAGHPVTFEATTDLFATPLTAQSTMKMQAMPISLFKEQLPPVLDLDADKGTFDLTLQNNWKDGQENGEALFLFTGLSPASPSADTALPLALLADRQDTIELRVPLVDSGDRRDSPVFTNTVKYVRRLILKSLVAPLLLTHENFSGLAVDVAPDFIDGESVLSDKGKAKLTLYRDLVVAHPRLKLVITGLADMDLDKKAIQEKLQEAEEKRVAKENLRRSQEWQRLQGQKPPQQQGQHKTAIVERDIPAEELARFAPLSPNPVTVPEQAINELARQRSNTAYAFLTTQLGLGPDRVAKITASEQATESINRVRVTLQPLVSPGISAPPSPDSPQ